MGKYDWDYPRWATIASDLDRWNYGLGDLAISASRLIPTRTELKKTVIAAGIGPVFPERALVCTIGSKFHQVKPDIHELICADPELLVDPEFYLSTPVVKLFLDRRQPEPSVESRQKGVIFYPHS